MKLSHPGTRSGQIEDRRGAGPTGGGIGMPLGLGAGLGVPGAIIAVLLYLFLGGGGGSGLGVNDPFQQLPGASTGANPIPPESDPQRDQVDFVSAVLDDVQGVWAQTFSQGGEVYPPAKLVLYDSATPTGCGQGSASAGPFYCPADESVYLDLSFFQELSQRFGAPGDFAQAYVIAHELGHHIQKITGVSDDVQAKSQDNPDDANELSVRLELQADCLAGVWGYTAQQRGILEDGDVEEGLAAAASVGDDRLQREAGRRVNPETWTHGSSEQRVTWFRRGFENGQSSACDTFSGDI